MNATELYMNLLADEMDSSVKFCLSAFSFALLIVIKLQMLNGHAFVY